MFARAIEIARKFTFPIIISHRKINGKCSAGIGACIIINEDGWFITAFHIINEILKLKKVREEYIQLITKRKEIDEDPKLKKHENMR
jgi:hypothetical protein